MKRRGRPRRDQVRELDFDVSDAEPGDTLSSDDRAEIDADLRRMSVESSTRRYATGYLDPI